MVKWSWKSDLRTDESWCWTPYSKAEATKIERAYQAGEKKLVLSKKYHIDFKNMIQHRADDYSRQRDIKREGPAAGSRKAPRDSDSDSSDAPPVKKTKAGKPLKGCVISMTGTLSETRAQIATFIEDNGGEFSKNVTNRCTHLVTTPSEAACPTDKVFDANKKGVPLVSEKWLRRSVALGVPQPIGPYKL
eukprot:TRINITY_DN14167_c0_g1_i1.p1 TRINITY_DN14167_c0_g1~~TRINITY_DN14167_c0_g1_i1.p1  ORF type:complete len:190 (+),score=20.75 TRINITY_DN14167_c0_g1_i1:65-634(+)